MKIALVVPVLLALSAPAYAGDTSPSALVKSYAAQAGRPASVANGKAFFLGKHSGGKPDTPSCSTCHTQNPRNGGRQVRTGKPIDPMAPRVNPKRFSDSKNVAKWFIRNCSTVLGRECSAGEKADIIAWLSSL